MHRTQTAFRRRDRHSTKNHQVIIPVKNVYILELRHAQDCHFILWNWPLRYQVLAQRKSWNKPQSKNNFCLVAVQCGQLVGFIEYIWVEWKPQSRIKNIYRIRRGFCKYSSNAHSAFKSSFDEWMYNVKSKSKNQVKVLFKANGVLHEQDDGIQNQHLAA